MVATPAALAVIAASGQTPAEFLDRHARGDWGEVSTGDARLNDAAVRNGERLLSAYRTKAGERLWVITEADRRSTCILLPDEY
jgi:hypothetical protein